MAAPPVYQNREQAIHGTPGPTAGYREQQKPPSYHPNQVQPAGVQMKSANSFRLETRPAPPVYRPSQVNSPSAQLKVASNFKLETRPAPPVYRPQQQGQVGVQPKPVGSFKIETRPAPPVYRPNQANGPSAQMKAASSFKLETRPAPAVYRPHQTDATVLRSIPQLRTISAPLVAPAATHADVLQLANRGGGGGGAAAAAATGGSSNSSSSSSSAAGNLMTTFQWSEPSSSSSSSSSDTGADWYSSFSADLQSSFESWQQELTKQPIAAATAAASSASDAESSIGGSSSSWSSASSSGMVTSAGTGAAAAVAAPTEVAGGGGAAAAAAAAPRRNRTGRPKRQALIDANRAMGLNPRGTGRARVGKRVVPYDPSPGGRYGLVRFNCKGQTRLGLNPGNRYIRKVKITYTGTRTGDYHAAGGAVAGRVWHHYHDYKLATNQGTMYLMTVPDHSLPHSGGVWMWEREHPGSSYG